MNDRKKRGAAGLLLLLLGLGVYFAFRGGTPRPPPDPLAGASPSPTAAAVETAPVEPAPVASVDSSASASAAEDPPSGSEEPRALATGVAPARRATVAKAVATAAPSAIAKGAETKADAGAPPVVSSAPVVAAAPVYPALVGQFMNRVGPQYRLLRVTCQLDGQTVYSGGGGAVTEIFRKMPPPGEHTISVTAEYQGNGGGVFSYFDGYKFSVKGGKTFASKSDAPTQVTIAAVEKGGPTTPFQDRLGLMVGVR